MAQVNKSQARRRAAAAMASEPQAVHLTETEDPDWGSEIDSVEELSLTHKPTRGTRLDDSMTNKKGGYGSGSKSHVPPATEMEPTQ